MKKRLLSFWIILAALSACTREDHFSNVPPHDPVPENGRLSAAEATEVAGSYMNLFESTDTRTQERGMPSVEVYGKPGSATRTSTGSNLDTLLYVVNYGGQGYVLVSGGRNTDTEIFGISPVAPLKEDADKRKSLNFNRIRGFLFLAG